MESLRVNAPRYSADMAFARNAWLRVETIHAVTYFAAESTEAATAAGLAGFWAGYFGFRAAPLGRVGAGVVEATFFNFAPSFVQRWVPDVWRAVRPEELLAARSGSASAALRRVAPAVSEVAPHVAQALSTVIDAAVGAGRPLFAANRLLALPNEPVAALWQLCTCLREHRGDGHVAALTAVGLDGIEAHVLIALEQGNSPEDLQRTRGWSADDWSAAVGRCQDRGLVAADGSLSAAGRALRAAVEATTDRLAAAPFAVLDAASRDRMIDALGPVAGAIAASGTIRYPNPMGLPAFL